MKELSDEAYYDIVDILGGCPHSAIHSSLESFGEVSCKTNSPKMEIACNGIGIITLVAPGISDPKRLTPITKRACNRLANPSRC